MNTQAELNGGITMTIKELSKRLGVSRQTIYNKLRNGFTIDDLIKLANYTLNRNIKIADRRKTGRPRKEVMAT